MGTINDALKYYEGFQDKMKDETTEKPEFKELIEHLGISPLLAKHVLNDILEIGNVSSAESGLEGDDFVNKKVTIKFKQKDGNIVSRKYDSGL